MDRFSKALKERIYLLSASQISNEEWNFNIRGQSNKVYKQILTPTKFSCACPDHCLRKGFCKHLLFLICRVAVNQSLAKELFENNNKWNLNIFNCISFLLIDRLKNRMENNKPKEISCNAIGSDCSICFEEMKNGEIFSQCLTTCKNYFHKECIDLWTNSGHNNCPLCRGRWITKDNVQGSDDINLEISLLNESSPAIQPVAQPVAEVTQVAQVVQPSQPVAQHSNVDSFSSSSSSDDEDDYTPSVTRTPIRATTDIITSYNNIRIIKSFNDANIKDVCSRNNIQYKNGNVYYEFLKAEKINNKKKIILMDKRSNDLFEGGCARDIIGISDMDINADINIKPGTLPDFYIFIQSTSPNRKILKNQRVIYKN
jgi:hypothetical protein